MLASMTCSSRAFFSQIELFVRFKVQALAALHIVWMYASATCPFRVFLMQIELLKLLKLQTFAALHIAPVSAIFAPPVHYAEFLTTLGSWAPTFDARRETMLFT
jgi:hypothetical protein